MWREVESLANFGYFVLSLTVGFVGIGPDGYQNRELSRIPLTDVKIKSREIAAA